MTGPLKRRAVDIAPLADERWDLPVVSDGIVGAGALLDAVSRGLRVALVEQDDIAGGTSSRSSRLIHGGLRYLQQGEVGLVREALAERAQLMRLAPVLRDRGEAVAPRVAEIAGGMLGWGADRQAREVAAYLEGARRAFAVPPGA